MSPVILCRVLGAVFILIAIWGFIDGAQVLIFHVNTAHNLVHLLSGAGALACGFAGGRAARVFCVVFGAVYGLVAVLGFAGVAPVVDLLHLNQPDNWLHAALAAAFLAGGLLKPRSGPASPGTPNTPPSPGPATGP